MPKIKDCQTILVPDNNGVIWMNNESKQLFFFKFHKPPEFLNHLYTRYHLHIVSDNRINDNDYFAWENPVNERVMVSKLVENLLSKATIKDIRYNGMGGAKKIIASTDYFLKGKEIPQIKISFIIHYIKTKPIDIKVEYNESCCKCDTFEKIYNCCYSAGDIEGTCTAPNPNKDFYGLKPKITNNYINIIL